MEVSKGAGVGVRVDAVTALVLREAYHKIQAMPRGNHYALYDYVRGVAATVAPVDTFFVGFLPERRFLSLTDAQQRVALLLVQGLDNEALAAELGVRLPTVKSHLGVILRKYGMESRVQVAHDVRRYLAR